MFLGLTGLKAKRLKVMHTQSNNQTVQQSHRLQWTAYTLYFAKVINFTKKTFQKKNSSSNLITLLNKFISFAANFRNAKYEQG